MRRLLALALLATLVAAPVSAQESEEGDERINQLIIYGDDRCPPGNEEEIVVCARLPESERFRIPPALRHNPNHPESQSWVNRAIEVSYVGRTGIGSCSPVGPGGFTGCHNELVRAARAERRQRSDIDWAGLIAEARRERLERNAAEERAGELP